MSLLILFRNPIPVLPPVEEGPRIPHVVRRTTEFLPKNSLYDLIYLTIDEGSGDTSYDKAESVNDNDLTLYGNYEWNNYKTNKYPGYVFRLSNYKLTLNGNKRARKIGE